MKTKRVHRGDFLAINVPFRGQKNKACRLWIQIVLRNKKLTAAHLARISEYLLMAERDLP